MKKCRLIGIKLCFILILNITNYVTIYGQTDTTASLYESMPLSNADNAITLDSSLFNQGFIVMPEELFLGKIPGMNIISNSGKPGDGFTIQNRGISSFLTDNNPLYVVDNLPIVNGYLNINPNDIATITVIKNAWAVALYGDRAAHGAIVITTKKGGGTAKVSYIGKVGISFLPKQVDVFSSDEFRKLVYDQYNAYFPEDIPMLDTLLGHANTNWQSEIYRTAISQDHHVAISNSINRIPYRISFGHTNLEGIIKTTSNKRNSLSVALTPSFFDNHLKVEMTLNGLFTEENSADKYVVLSAVMFDPTQAIRNSDGSYYKTGYFFIDNPVEKLNLTNNNLCSDRYISKVSIDYRLHFIPDLRVILNYGEDYLKTDNRETETWYYTYDELKDQKLISKYWDLSANYYKNIEAISSNISFVIGIIKYNRSNSSKDFLYVSHILNNATIFDSKLKLNTTYMRIGYSLKNRYCLNFSNRKETASISDYNNRTNHVYTATLKWIVKNEPFLSSNRTISTLNLRAEYGISGANPKMSNSLNDLTRVYSSPEKITAKSLGVDYGLFHDRIYGSIEFYSNTSDNLFFRYYASGVNFVDTRNNGKLKNSGVEASINAIPLLGKAWQWKIGFNAAFNRNKIKALNTSINGSADYSTYDGSSILLQREGHPINSFNVKAQAYDSQGNPIESNYTTGTRPYHKAQPDWIMGLSSQLSYKNWDFAFSSRISLGNYVYNYVSTFGCYSSITSLNNAPKSLNKTKFSKSQRLSDYYVENASFFRMDFITLGYSFENVWNCKASIRLSVAVQNAFVITNYSGIDPELATGIDNFGYPRARTFSLGLNMNF